MCMDDADSMNVLFKIWLHENPEKLCVICADFRQMSMMNNSYG